MQYEETKGYMAVSNSTVNGNRAYSYPSVTGGGGIFPGWYGTGVLTIGEGAVITSNFMVAYGSDKACGAVYQHDGDVTFVASSKSEQRGYTGVVGYDGYGYYEMRKGRLKMLGRPCIGSSDSGCGILSIHGGETVIDRHFAESAADPWLILANKGVGHLYVAGGSLVSKSYIIVGYADNYSAYMTIGSEGFVDCGIMIIGYAKSGRYFVNFNGGVFSCSSAQFRNDGRDNKVYYNFNGGTLKAKGSPFPEPNSDNNNQTFVTLYAGGMRFNSNGLNYELSCPVPIVEASGLGVVSVPLPEGLSDMDLAGSPFVEITGGGGSGAFAYAEFNSVARKVTGVRVICPGQNYTSPPTATFKMGSSVLGVSTCVLAENAPGGVEKLGEGTFVVNFPSDYRGDTIVSGGTLKAGCDWAISTNSAVVLKNGGVLDFNSKKGAVKALTYGAGGGLLKNAANVEIVSDFDIVLSADDVMGGAAASFGGKIDLDGKTLKVNGDLSAIAEGSARRYTLVSAPEITGEPVFECGELPKYWTLRVRNASVELVRARNFSLVVR
jgi:autotransporter-associated beta strand protein